jgi:hypothetical protein
MAWLRGTEHFELRHCDVERTRPIHGPRKGLPAGIGCLEERLNPIPKHPAPSRLTLPLPMSPHPVSAPAYGTTAFSNTVG